jgi:hypothetical protein
MDTGYFEGEPWSFGTKTTIKQFNPDIKNQEIQQYLDKNEIYTRFKQHKKSRKYSPIYVFTKRELFQADVVFFTDMENQNSGFKYLFTCIDCFSKMAWVYPLKKNDCDSIMTSFKDILNVCGQKPERLNSDRGSELICKKFAIFLKNEKIHHYLSYSLRKCPIIERFNLTIQTLLYKIMAKNRSLSWTKYIDQAMKIYLNRKHSTIGMSPIQAEHNENAKTVRKNLLIFFHKRGFKKTKPKFAVNDTVRIWKKRTTFQRGYDESFSIEYFKIAEVKQNLPVPRYVLQDSKGDIVTGSFFEDELVKFEPSDVFEIQVLKERKKGKQTEYLVHYKGYPSSMDEWITKKQLVKL